jgi:hypothetical protein
VVSVPVLVSPVMAAEAAVKAPVTPRVVLMTADFRVATPLVVRVALVIKPVMLAEAADKAPVTVALFKVAAPDVVSVAVDVAPETVADAEVRALVTVALFKVAAPDVVSVPVLVSPVMAAEAAVKAPVTPRVVLMTADFRVATPLVVRLALVIKPVMLADAADNAFVTVHELSVAAPELKVPTTAAVDALNELVTSEPVFSEVVTVAVAADRLFVITALFNVATDEVDNVPVLIELDERVLLNVAPDTFKPPLRMLKFLLETSNITSNPSDADINLEL